jgi:hypothetical protein
VFIGQFAHKMAMQHTVAKSQPGIIPLHTRRYSLDTRTSPASSNFLHQVGQLQQIFVAEQAAARSQSHKGICCHHCRPARWDRTQAASAVVEVNAILAPVVAVDDQLETLAS